MVDDRIKSTDSPWQLDATLLVFEPFRTMVYHHMQQRLRKLRGRYERNLTKLGWLSKNQLPLQPQSVADLTQGLNCLWQDIQYLIHWLNNEADNEWLKAFLGKTADDEAHQLAQKELQPLLSILLHHASIRVMEKSAVVVRQNEHAGSAYLLLAGQACALQVKEKALFRQRPEQHPWYRRLKQNLFPCQWVERRDTRRYDAAQQVTVSQGRDSYLRIPDLAEAREPDTPEPKPLEAGELFGAVAALQHSPHYRTIVVTSEQATLLEVRWQGVRQLARFDRGFRQFLDQQYRRHRLPALLQQQPILLGLNKSQLEHLAAIAELDSFGTMDWKSTTDQNSDQRKSRIEQSEPLIIKEGEYANAVIFIRAGYARKSKAYGHSERALDYLRQGDCYGFQEILGGIQLRGQQVSELTEAHLPRYSCTIRAVGYTDIVRIPARELEKVLAANKQPISPETSQPAAMSSTVLPSSQQHELLVHEASDLLEFFIDQRFIYGTQTMLINLDRCTGCDDCVRACATVHDQNPRFIRHGHQHGGFMVANACMQCSDPLCLDGCPTGAIYMNNAGTVVINDDICVGCSTCADNCPFDNIQMVKIVDEHGKPVHTSDQQGKLVPQLKATKCDMCTGQLSGPACEKACPHDALRRVDIHQVEKIRDWLA